MSSAGPAADDTASDDDADAVVMPAVRSPDPWSGLLRTGLDLLSQFAVAQGTIPGDGRVASPVFERVRDDRSGQSYLKIKMPEPEVVDRVVGALQALLANLKA